MRYWLLRKDILPQQVVRIGFYVSIVGLVLLISACSRPEAWTPEERSNAEFVLIAFREAAEANRIGNAGRGITIPDTEIIAIKAHLRAAIEAGDRVSEPVLAKINPGLQARWRGQFIEGMRQRLKNLENQSGDLQAEWLGSAMLDRFADWYALNRKKLKIPRQSKI